MKVDTSSMQKWPIDHKQQSTDMHRNNCVQNQTTTLSGLKSLREKYKNSINSPQIFVEPGSDDSDEEIQDYLKGRINNRRRSSLCEEMTEENRGRRLENAMEQLTVGNIDYLTSRSGSITGALVSDSEMDLKPVKNLQESLKTSKCRKSNFLSNSNASLNSIDSQKSVSLTFKDIKNDQTRPSYQKSTKAFRNKSVGRRFSISNSDLNKIQSSDDELELPPLPGLPTVLAPIWSAPKARDSLSIKKREVKLDGRDSTGSSKSGSKSILAIGTEDVRYSKKRRLSRELHKLRFCRYLRKSNLK